jgi:8-oxo-dGTP diphosphatase
MEVPKQPAVVLAVVIGPAAVLVVARRDGEPPWAFPGGSIEPGETPQEAAVREVLEEVGIRIVPRDVIGERVHPRTGVRLVYVSAELAEGLPRFGPVGVTDRETLAAARWLPPAQLGMLMPDLFEQVKAYLHNSI